MGIYYLLYFLLFIIEAFLGTAFNGNKQKQKNIFLIISLLLVGLLLGLRHQSMGIDLGYDEHKLGYLRSFDLLNDLSWERILHMERWANYERGYIIYNKLIGSICNNRQFFLFVSAFISLIPVFYLIKKESKIPLLSVIIYLGLPVFQMQYSGIRQNLAIGVTIMSVKFIQEKKIIPFLVVVWFASFFHSSALMFLAAYPMYHIKMSNILRGVTVLLIPVVFIFKEQIFIVLSRLLKEEANIQETGALTLFLVFVGVYIYLIIFNEDSNKNQNGMISLFYLACLCQAFGGIYNTAMRVGYYFMPYLAIALPNNIIKNKDEFSYRINYITILLAFLVYGLYAIKNSTWSEAYPYLFFWE